MSTAEGEHRPLVRAVTRFGAKDACALVTNDFDRQHRDLVATPFYTLHLVDLLGAFGKQVVPPPKSQAVGTQDPHVVSKYQIFLQLEFSRYDVVHGERPLRYRVERCITD